MVPKEYKRAESRLKESIKLRRAGLHEHDYPLREEDLEIMRQHHAEHGIPPADFWTRLRRLLGGR